MKNDQGIFCTRNSEPDSGGFVDWERDGLPVTPDISARLSGSCMCQIKPREGIRRQA